MQEVDPLGPANENWFATIVSDGTATPKEACRLLKEFVRQADAKQVSPRMIEHLRDCIAAFLANEKVLLPAPADGRPLPMAVPIPTLEKAFGLKRIAPGQPKTDRDTRCEVAAEVLAQRIKDATLEAAIESVAADRKARGDAVTSESRIRAIWAKHRSDAITFLRIYQGRPWTDDELERLNELFFGELWFCPPGADAKARRQAILAEVDRPGADLAPAEERARAAAARVDAPFAPKNYRNK